MFPDSSSWRIFDVSMLCRSVRNVMMKRQFSVTMAVAIFLLSASFAQDDSHEGAYHKNLKYTGPVTGDEILYTLYLPRSHRKGAGTYPLVIFLHGAGGGNSSFEVMQSYEAARQSGLIGDAIFLFPEKYGGTAWRDGVKGKNAETNVLRELLPYLEKEYGATSDREQRTIMGFSMGAAGSIFWGGKYPELFSTVVALDAGGGNSVSDPTMRNYIPEYIENTETIRSSVKIRLVQGGLNTKNFQETLKELAIPFDLEYLPNAASDYLENSCCLNKKDPSKKFLHNPKCMTEGEWGKRTWEFIDANTRWD